MDSLLAYLAGAIDADGYITVQRTRRTVGKRYAHAPTYYLPKIGLGQAHETIPRLLQETFGGAVAIYKPKNPAHRTRYVWACGTRQVRDAAERLIPYLRLKREQAEHVVELAVLIEAQHTEQMRTQKPPYRVTPDQEDARRVLWDAVTRLNQPRNRRVHLATPSGSGI